MEIFNYLAVFIGLKIFIATVGACSLKQTWHLCVDCCCGVSTVHCPVWVQGLQRLEHRDVTGLRYSATPAAGWLAAHVTACGRALMEQVKTEHVKYHLGIAHTRWPPTYERQTPDHSDSVDAPDAGLVSTDHRDHEVLSELVLSIMGRQDPD